LESGIAGWRPKILPRHGHKPICRLPTIIVWHTPVRRDVITC